MAARLVIAAVLVAGLLGLALIVNRDLFRESPAVSFRNIDAGAVHRQEPPRPDAARSPAQPSMRIVEIEGIVDRLIDGKWTPIKPGDELSPSDPIRTREDGRAVLSMAGVTFELDSVTELSSVLGSRIQLVRGRVHATVEGGGGDFGVSVDGTDTVARTSDGEFHVSAEEGKTVVAAARGDVRLSANNKEVLVPAGKLSIVNRGRAPSAPVQIPSSLFLKVKRPGKKVQRSNALALTGTTTPGATLFVNGRRVVVDETGRFSTVVALEEGNNKVLVQTRDVLGRRDNEDVDVQVDTQGPRVDGKVEWGSP